MTKTKVIFKEWKLEVDKELTQQTYFQIEKGSAESCGCHYCRNFALQRESIYRDDVKVLFFLLGIDYSKETEISHLTKLENGLHLYSGWFHFKGDFIGKDCSVPLPNGGYTLELTSITESFNIGFRRDNALTAFKDKEHLVQVEFECEIPWVIEKELETE